MTIKGVLIDISGTLVDKIGPRAHYIDGMIDLLDFLRQSGITPILVSNNLTQAGIENVIAANEPLKGSLGLTKERIGKAKGSPLWIDTACTELGVSSNELVYVGDSKWDMITASQGEVVYFHAGWSSPHDEYGVNVNSPREFLLILQHVFLKERLWFWTFSGNDNNGRPIKARALIDGNGAQIARLKSDLMSLKNGYDTKLGTITLRQFLILHLLASIYLEGLHAGVAVWAAYPGSKGGQSPLVEPLLDTAAKLFSAKLRPELIERHTKIEASHKKRIRGEPVPFSHESDTVRLSSGEKSLKKLEGRKVIVFDDFITDGHASELARNWLLEAGASEAITVCVGKYGPRYEIQNPLKHWNPLDVTKALPFSEYSVSVLPDWEELSEFAEHYRSFKAESDG